MNSYNLQKSAKSAQTLYISVPTKPIFSANRQSVGARANIFGKTVHIALENLTNLWKYDIWYTLILHWYKIYGT